MTQTGFLLMRNRTRYTWAEGEGPVGLPTELLFMLLTLGGGIATLYGIGTFVCWLVRLARA